jgi:putative two-component system response regulator
MLGRDSIEAAERQLGMEADFLKLAKEIVYYHHEKWDGSGYPTGKAGEDIPISARLMAVADAYDTLIGRRVYKEGMPHEQVVPIIVAGKESHFDPDVVDAFVKLQDEFRAISTRYADSLADMVVKALQFEQMRGGTEEGA